MPSRSPPGRIAPAPSRTPDCALAAGLDALGGHAAEAVVLLHDRRAASDVSGGADVPAPAPDDDAVVAVVPAAVHPAIVVAVGPDPDADAVRPPGPDLDALGGRSGRTHEQKGKREGD